MGAAIVGMSCCLIMGAMGVYALTTGKAFDFGDFARRDGHPVRYWIITFLYLAFGIFGAFAAAVVVADAAMRGF
jgi:L-asparagine transporter-like permease